MQTPTPTRIASPLSSGTAVFSSLSRSISRDTGTLVIRKLLCGSALVVLLTVAARAQNVFVYTNDDVSGGNAVSGFSVASNGVLAAIAGSPFSTGGSGGGGGLFAANRVSISTAGRFLYAGNTGSGSVAGFSINGTTGFLTTIPGSPFPTGGVGEYSLAVTPDSKFLFCGNAGSGTISAFAIVADGSLSPVPDSPFAVGSTIDEVNTSPNGKFLSAALPDNGPFGSVAMFSILSNGALAVVPGSPFAGAGAGFITGIDMNCAGNLLFASNALSGSAVVNVFSVDSSGALTAVPGSPFTFSGEDSNVPFVSPDGKLLFVSNQFTNNFTGSVTVLNIATDGRLTEVPGSPFANPGGLEPSGIATDVAGRFLFAANFNGTISVYNVATNGVLTPAPASPFATGRGFGLLSLAVFPGKSCGGPTFDTCMRDNSTGDVFAFDSISGAYRYTRCVDGFSISGNGAVRNVGGVLSLTDYKNDRRISAAFVSGQLTGNATVMVSVAQGVWQTFSIHDTTSLGRGCSCGP